MSISKEELLFKLKTQKEIFGDDLYEKIIFEPELIPKDKPKTIDNNMVKLRSEAPKVVEKKINSKEAFAKASSLDELYDEIHTCQKCELGSTRINFVYGVGNPNADLMLVGEAPGAEEDKQGVPFVGRAGKLLTDILKAINFERDDVYIANILKCRPPGNRDPKPSERETCSPYLWKQIELINPKIILCLGRISANVLLNKNESLTRLRENVFELNGVKVMATYHPAALLRNPNWKRGCWEDVQKVKKLYDELTK
jgi:uracil-DNA glycosylase family 4